MGVSLAVTHTTGDIEPEEATSYIYIYIYIYSPEGNPMEQ
jgi:hypothetical protein